MGKIRDFFYNQSDVFLAILILALAGFIIYSRVGVIMEFNGDNKSAMKNHTNYTTTSQKASSQNQTSDIKADKNGKHLDKSGNPIKCSIYVPYGANADQIASLTVSAQIMENTQQFYEAFNKYSAGRNLLSGTFIIPLDATDEEIIQYLTGVKK